MNKRFVILITALLIMALAVVPVLADDGIPAELETLSGVFAWLASGAAGVLFSEWLKKQQWYAGLDSGLRGFIAWTLPIVSAVVGKLLLDFVPDATLAVIQPYWHAIWIGLMASVAANINWRVDKQ